MRLPTSRPSLTLLAALAVLAGCKDKPRATPDGPHAHRPVVLATIPVYRQSQQTDTTGTDEVERASWVLQRPADSLSRFYRDTLPKLGWRIMSDEGDRQKVDLYARRDTLSLWVHIEALGVLASRYTVIAGTAGAGDKTGPIGTPLRPRP